MSKYTNEVEQLNRFKNTVRENYYIIPYDNCDNCMDVMPGGLIQVTVDDKDCVKCSKCGKNLLNNSFKKFETQWIFGRRCE